METAELIREFKSLHAENVKRHDEQKAALDALKTKTSEIDVVLMDLAQKSDRRRFAPAPFNGGDGDWGASIINNPGFKTWAAGNYEGKARFKLDGKTVTAITSSTSTGGGMIAPHIITDPVALPYQRMTVRKLLAPGRTTSNSVQMPQQTARQNNAAPVAELAAKPQSDFTMQLIDFPVRTIAHFVQASRQVMDDAPALQSFIDAELRYGLALAEEGQLLTGDGTGQNLLGLLPQATAYSAVFAVSDETLIDRAALALRQVELQLFPADGIIVHPTDFLKMRLTKDGQGRYILGGPSAPTPPVLWGVPLVVTPAITAGTFLAGSFFNAAQIFDRMDVEVLVSTEAGTNFTTNQVTIRAEERLALATKRPGLLVTGNWPA